MRRLSLPVSFLLLSGALAACGGGFSSPRRRTAAPPPGTVTAPGPAAPAPAAPAGGSGPLEQLNAVDAYLSQQGFARVGPAVRNANMPAGGLIAYAIDGQPGQCFVAVALAQASSDLNIIVLDPRGQDVGHDVNPDATPNVRFCPSAPGRHVARLQMARGGGEYYYALYQGGANADPQLASFLGTAGSTAPPPAQTAQVDTAARSRLSGYDQQLSGERFERVGEPQGVVLGDGQDRRFPLTLEQGYCYAFASVAGQGARDSDLYILNGAGETIQSDTRIDQDALVRYCPPSTGSFTLRALLYDGEGPLFIAAWVQAAQGSPAAAAPDATVISNTSTAGGGVAEAFALRDADIRARGYEPYGEQGTGTLPVGQTAEQSINLEGGKCYAVVATGDNRVRDLDLTIVDRSGRQIDRDGGPGATGTVRVCAPSTGSYRVQVRMEDGGGDYMYQAYRWPRGTRGPFGLSGLIYVRLAEVTSLLSVEGYEPDANFSPGRGTLRREGATTTHSLELPGGRCYAVLVVGGDGVSDLDLRLRSGANELAGDTSVNAFPDVRYCTPSSGRLTLQVEAQAGAGDYFYQVFSRAN
ncbi:MAG: hypothetical protein AAGH15_27155 [Myxococcota bacterium]